MASGVSSSAVGTLAGQITMQGFVGLRVPLWVRRVATMVPPFMVMATGYGATQALVLSQLVLSLILTSANGFFADSLREPPCYRRFGGWPLDVDRGSDGDRSGPCAKRDAGLANARAGLGGLCLARYPNQLLKRN